MRKPEFAERNLSQVWDRLPETTQKCLLVRFKRAKPPGKQLPELESTEEIEAIMTGNKEVRR